MVERCYVKMTQLIFSSSPWRSIGKGGDSSEVEKDVTRDKGREKEWLDDCQLGTLLSASNCLRYKWAVRGAGFEGHVGKKGVKHIV